MAQTLKPQDAKTFSEYWDSMFLKTTTKIPVSFVYLAFEHFCNICFIVGDFGKLKYAWENENPLPLPRINLEEKYKELFDLQIRNKIPQYPQYGHKVDPNSKTTEATKELNICELIHIGQELWTPTWGKVKVIDIAPNKQAFRIIGLSNAWEQVLLSNGIVNSNNICPTAECIIFPSKDQRDWSKYHPCQFTDGELVWIKRYHSEFWNALYHSGTMTTDNKHLVHECQKKNGKLIEVEDCRKFDQRPF